ncbi:MAG: tripartite tricarboxylate transporter TctB family protein [Bacillota bacterium]
MSREAVQDFAIALLALAGFLYTYTFKRPGAYALGSSVSAAVWPRILLAGIGILSCLLAIQEIRRQNKARATQGQEAKSTEESPADIRIPDWMHHQAYARLFWLIGLLGAHAALTPVLGFIMATLLAQVALLYLLGLRTKKLLLGVPILVMAIVYLIFIRALNMSLPRGIGPFLEFSRFFY